MNIKTAVKTQKQNSMKGLASSENDGNTKTLKPANGRNLPRGMGTDKTAYIIKLLDTVSQQLRRSETERELLWKELEETRRLLSAVDERTGKYEKSYNFIRQEVERTQQESLTFIEQLNIVEGRALNAVEKLESISEENARLTHSVERLAQDKTRLNRKVNIIEEAVTSTREALEAKALVLLTDKAIAHQSSYPSLDAANIYADHNDVTPAKTPEALVDEETAKIKKRLFGGASITVLMILGVASVWGFSHFGLSLQNKVASVAPEYTSSAAPSYDTGYGVQTQTYQRGSLAGAAEYEAFNDVVEDTVEANDGDINSVADMMNALEPSADVVEEITPAADVKEAPVPEVKAETVAATPVTEATTVQTASAPVQETVVVAQSPAPKSVSLSGDALKRQLDKLEQDAVAKAFPSKELGALASRAKPDARLDGFAKEIETAAFSGNPEAQHDLAALYTAGQEGVPQDFEKAFFWFTEAGRENVANARYNLGVLYQQGLGTFKNVMSAMDMYRSAALLGHPEAQYNLGIAYAEGIGVPYSIEAAIHYFEKSAVIGVAESAFNLGLIYENGLLGRKDSNKALFWYNMAAEQDNIEAQNALGLLTTKLGLSVSEVRDIITLEQDEIPALQKVNQVSAVAKNMPRAVDTVRAVQPSENEIIDVRDVMPAQDDYDLIAPIQQQLMALGLYPGPADGIMGPMTADAIRSYQTMFNLTPNGQATAQLVEHMMNNVSSAGGQ